MAQKKNGGSTKKPPAKTKKSAAPKRSSSAKSAGSAKTSAKAPAKSASRTKVEAQSQNRNPHRREIGAAVCLLLAVFGIIGFFTGSGVFISYYAQFLKGLTGYGFYVVPFGLLWCAAILAFHRGRPVVLRVTATLLLCIVLGSLIHIFAGAETLPFDKYYVRTIWTSGLAVESGGLFSGTVAVALTRLFTGVGAAIILLLGLLLLLMTSIHVSPSDVVRAIRSRPRREYVYPEEDEPVPAQTTLPPVPEQPVRQARPGRARTTPVMQEVDPAPRTQASVQAAAPKQAQTPAEPKPQPKQEPFTITHVEAAETLRQNTPYLEELGDPVPPKGEAPDGIPFMNQQLKKAPSPTHNGKVSLPTVDGQGRVPRTTGAPPEPVAPPTPLRRDGPIETPPVQEPRPEPKPEPAPIRPAPEPIRPAPKPEPKPEPAAPPEPKPEPPAEPEQITVTPLETEGYVFPPIDLLARNTSGAQEQEDVAETSKRLETSFRSFGVNVKIIGCTCGPAVTRYEAELEPGIKLSKITNLAADIALSIGASGVRIAAMPNKISTVGIEVPNRHVASVYLREIIESDPFTTAKSKLTFAIGRSIAGDAIVGNIAKLPHLLVAGTTGSGKSVCLNSIMLSILYKAKPDEVRFIMVDPKMVEFKVYNGIPHLLIPVVTDAKKASGALQWAVTEMLKRYRLFSETTARDLAGYNDYVEKLGDPEQPKLPQIVIFIDELADLMMIAKKEVEDSIVRIAQMGRAAGMHLVVATQSPRADVITGLMKANIPSRIALKVSNSLESRIILDAGGNADKLVGNGDMLYSPIGVNEPIRIQGTWVSDEEREAVIEFVKKQGEADYSNEVIKQIENAATAEEEPAAAEDEHSPAEEYDELLPQAVEVIFESKQASSSMLQRRLKVGYTRAARLIDQMEELGIVGPFEGSKPRQLLISYQQWQEMQFIHGTAPDAALPRPDDFTNPDFIDTDEED